MNIPKKLSAIFSSAQFNNYSIIRTPSKTLDRMQFQEDSQFIVVSALSRTQNNHEADAERLNFDYYGSN
jgi:hypothetical protein